MLLIKSNDKMISKSIDTPSSYTFELLYFFLDDIEIAFYDA